MNPRVASPRRRLAVSVAGSRATAPAQISAGAPLWRSPPLRSRPATTRGRTGSGPAAPSRTAWRGRDQAAPPGRPRPIRPGPARPAARPPRSREARSAGSGDRAGNGAPRCRAARGRSKRRGASSVAISRYSTVPRIGGSADGARSASRRRASAARAARAAAMPVAVPQRRPAHRDRRSRHRPGAERGAQPRAERAAARSRTRGGSPPVHRSSRTSAARRRLREARGTSDSAPSKSAKASSTTSQPPRRCSRSARAHRSSRARMRPSGLLGLTDDATSASPASDRQRANLRDRVARGPPGLGVLRIGGPEDRDPSARPQGRQQADDALRARRGDDAAGIRSPVGLRRGGFEVPVRLRLGEAREHIRGKRGHGIGDGVDSGRQIDPRLGRPGESAAGPRRDRPRARSFALGSLGPAARPCRTGSPLIGPGPTRSPLPECHAHMTLPDTLTLLLAALVLEAALGYPAPLYTAIGHPVTWIGRLIAALDRALNRETCDPRPAARGRAPRPCASPRRHRARDRAARRPCWPPGAGSASAPRRSWPRQPPGAAQPARARRRRGGGPARRRSRGRPAPRCR